MTVFMGMVGPHPDDLKAKGAPKFICVQSVPGSTGEEVTCCAAHVSCPREHLPRPTAFSLRVASGQHANSGWPWRGRSRYDTRHMDDAVLAD